MLINFSNHPSSDWGKLQFENAISKYGEINDIEFPSVSPEFTELQITDLAQKYVRIILNLRPAAVHIMGEMNFTHKCVYLLKLYGITCLASTSERNTIEEDGTKLSTFRFIQFREY
jgi:hypothetical protein